MIPAYVLSAHNTGLGVIRALGRHGIPMVAVTYESHDMGAVSRYVRHRLETPHPERAEAAFLAALETAGAQHGRGLLIPADDATLTAISRNKARLSERFIVACTEWNVTRLYLDKSRTYEAAAAAGLPVPRTRFPRDASDVLACGREIGFPCLVKPCFSHRYAERFHRKMVMVRDTDALQSAWERAAEAGEAVMVQEYIPGPDSYGINYNAYVHGGRVLAEFTARKVRMAPTEFGVPAVVVSERMDDVPSLGRRVLEIIGFDGYACTEFKWDARDRTFKLMEVNGRHNRSALLAVRGGLNMPLIEYQHRVEGREPTSTAYHEGVYWIDEFRDLFSAVSGMRRTGASPAAFLRPYIRPHVFAVFDRTDPRPFLKRAWDLVRMAFQPRKKTF